MALKAQTIETNEESAKPKVKRQTAVSLRKEIESLRATNMKLLNDIGNLSAMYMNALKDANNQQEPIEESDAILRAIRKILEVVLPIYGKTPADIFKN